VDTFKDTCCYYNSILFKNYPFHQGSFAKQLAKSDTWKMDRRGEGGTLFLVKGKAICFIMGRLNMAFPGKDQPQENRWKRPTPCKKREAFK
jgi:hypothetical protein